MKTLKLVAQIVGCIILIIIALPILVGGVVMGVTCFVVIFGFSLFLGGWGSTWGESVVVSEKGAKLSYLNCSPHCRD